MLKELKELTWPMRVLLVDDEEIIREHVKTLFSNLFHHVEVAANGALGLDLYRQRGAGFFDLVVTDIQMPVMDGLEMAAAISDLSSEQRLIVISAHNEPEFFTRAIEIGVDGFIIKPAQPRQLYETLRRSAVVVRAHKENQRYRESLEQMVQERVEEIEELMSRDPLTGLGNRQKLIRDMEQSGGGALIVLDMDYFGEINDFYGHRVGDMVIVELANRVFSILPKECRLYRYHGARLAIVAPDGFERNRVVLLARDLCDQLSHEHIEIGGSSFTFEVTTAVSFEAPHVRFKTAEMALNHAQTHHIGSLVYRDTLMLEATHQHNIEWTKRFTEALREGRVVPYFQPICNTQTGKVEKYEALARMMEGDGSVIVPGLFIDIAKRSRQYLAMTRTIFDQAMAALENTDASVSVNLTLEDLLCEETTGHILSTLRVLPSERIVLELVESEGIENFEQVARFFGQAKEAGAKTAIDDFGSGYSNFSYLLKLKVDYIKIDGSLIQALNDDPAAHAVVETIVSFAHQNGFETIAEFVSDESILERVKALGIGYSQGYHIGKPGLL